MRGSRSLATDDCVRARLCLAVLMMNYTIKRKSQEIKSEYIIKEAIQQSGLRNLYNSRAFFIKLRTDNLTYYPSCSKKPPISRLSTVL